MTSRIVGYARHLNRGGKPEFYGVSLLACRTTDLRITKGEAVFIADIMNAKVSLSDIEELRRSPARAWKQYAHSASVVLCANLRFLCSYLRSEPAAFMELVARLLSSEGDGAENPRPVTGLGAGCR